MENEQEYWHHWTCAHTGKKYKTHFFTEEEKKKEFERQFTCISRGFEKLFEVKKT